MSSIKCGVFILRGQPVHNAHVAIINQILSENDHAVILIGSASVPSTFKNPFTWQIRASMIMEALNYPDNISIVPINDYLYDDIKWATHVQQAVTDAYNVSGIKYTLYGHVKDDTEFYLNLFGSWEKKFLPAVEPLNATQIRNMYFSESYNHNMIAGVVPANVVTTLNRLYKTTWWQSIVDENNFIQQQRAKYAHLPYEIIFSTADAVVTQGANILLIKRKAIPGKGLWALPGGYVNAKTDKSVFDASVRELMEETKIKVPEQVLRRCVINHKMFDHPDRSPRGRIITNTYHYDLMADRDFPKVKGSDDAAEAKWFPLNQVTREMMFEDHWDQISHFTGI